MSTSTTTDELLAPFRTAFPEAVVAIEGTGGGCDAVTIRWPGEPGYYLLTDGEASAPRDPLTGNLAHDRWGWVGRMSDWDDSADYEGTPLLPEVPAPGMYLDATVIEALQQDRPRLRAATAWVACFQGEWDAEAGTWVDRGAFPAMKSSTEDAVAAVLAALYPKQYATTAFAAVREDSEDLHLQRLVADAAEIAMDGADENRMGEYLAQRLAVLLCCCTYAECGDAETGPQVSVDADEACPVHGREADPEGWQLSDQMERGYVLTNVAQCLRDEAEVAALVLDKGKAGPWGDLTMALHAAALSRYEGEDDGHDVDRACADAAVAITALAATAGRR